ncbi:RlpA-like double-psi beta-barrel (DPBB) domain-containing protein [Phanerochaete sordida]|uniref:RlpA-like double-psi beta-barrel (DPBB) domain-containing protein n=1 Tax=Phanerochaete sordida TaxID=48140 RepID=A0A9P3GBB1_9APHY|nr:RlpA-like double-psi beta-barrel (DPBB) domain-containing protein [Phanerochaete sordida]
MQFTTFVAALFLSVFMSLFAVAAPLVELEERSAKITGTKSGDGTWFTPGLGACGKWNDDSDHIVAIGTALFDQFPGYNGANPNNNPACGRKIKANYKGKSVTVTVVDRCTGCSQWSLDFSPAAFTALAPQSVGRLHDVSWEFQ